MDHRQLAVRGSAWLAAKGVQTAEQARGERSILVTAGHPASWKTAIGAAPVLEVEVKGSAAGPEIEVRQGRSEGSRAALWAKRYMTYSWVAYGASYLTIKNDLDDYVATEVGPPRAPAAGEPKVIAV